MDKVTLEENKNKMKEKDKRNLLNKIVGHCKKYKIKGSFNNKCGDYLVSFEIKQRDAEQDKGEKDGR